MMGFSSHLFLPNPEGEPATAAGVYLTVGPLAVCYTCADGFDREIKLTSPILILSISSSTIH